MSSIVAFVALLVLSYLGGLLSSSRLASKLGFSSAVEYVVLGIVVGPHALGLFRHDTVVGFEPLLLMVLGWLAAVLGLHYARFGGERVQGPIFFAGILLASATGAGVFLVTRRAPSILGESVPQVSTVLALGMAAVCSGSAHQAVSWATRGRSEARSTSQVIGGIGSADDLPPLLMLSSLALFSSRGTSLSLPPWVVPILGLALGVVLGGTVAALLGPRLRRSEFWPVLLGAVLLVVGIALRLDLPLLTPVFLFGCVLALLSPHRDQVRELVAPTERPLLVPALLLTGALVKLPESSAEWLIVGIALAMRLVLQFTLGASLSLFFSDLKGQGRVLGQALLPTGGASLTIALAIYFRHPGQVGRVVLFVAVAATLIGELIGGRALRRVAASELMIKQELTS